MVIGVMAISCTLNESISQEVVFDNGKLICPKNHTDNIILIDYGLPNESLFTRANSGKIWLVDLLFLK